jgi:hypothetical protein
MKFLYFTLILFFALLIVNHNNEDKIIESVTTSNSTNETSANSSSNMVSNGSANLGYQNYDDENNAYILAQKNTANIQYINERLNDIKSMEDEITKLSNNVKINNVSIKQISNIISHQINKLSGNSLNLTPSSTSTSTSTSTSSNSSVSNKLPPTPMPKLSN